MNLKNCLNCNIQPVLQTDELGMTYRLICPVCANCTQDIISHSSSLDNPHADEETLIRLYNEWNDKN